MRTNPFQNLFQAQHNKRFQVANTTYKARIAKLDALKDAIEGDFKQKIREALYADFKKPHLETDLTEIYSVISEIKFVKSKLKRWMSKQKVKTPLSLIGTSSWYVYEPKGVCLIISPWNFPFNLSFEPLVSAIAAGNTVILKPSEHTPHTAQVMADLIGTVFPEHEVAVVQGEVDVSTALLELPFNHIFFTGSPNIGKVVMEAASKHLTSVTLELGGKSPTIIDETANLKAAAERIAWGKFMNSGQICVSPDYVLIHERVKTEFIALLKTNIEQFYGEDSAASADYARIVNSAHTSRLQDHLEDAKKHQATIEFGGDVNLENCYVSPTLISNVPDEASLLQDEIFGPILPIKTFSDIQEAVDYVNTKPKPLALYIYSNSKQHTDFVIKQTRAGTTCINSNVLQYNNHHLPFGGSNTSGIGKSHGLFGFQEFSNMRSVLKQYSGGAISFLFPPYTPLKQRLVDFTLKWF